MTKRIRIFFLLLFFSTNIFSQQKIGEFESASGFRKGSYAAAYYIQELNGYQLNQQVGDNIVRTLYDSSFTIIKSYEVNTQVYSFNKIFKTTPVYAMDLHFKNRNFEMYLDNKTLLLVEPDFDNKKDSIVFTYKINYYNLLERPLAIMPFANSLGLLYYFKKENKLVLYKWHSNGTIDTADYLLPKSSMSPKEIKKYTKYARVKYKNALYNLQVCRADEPSLLRLLAPNTIYYTDKKIWILLQMPFNTGYSVLDIDIDKNTAASANYFINDMKKNVESKLEFEKILNAVIWKNKLIIRNTSYKSFEYFIYNLSTKQLIKKYSSLEGTPITSLINSDLNQNGTWYSANNEKNLTNEKAFLRKLQSGYGFICVSENDKDSLTVTTGSIKQTQGLIGSLITIGSLFISSKMGFVIGAVQIIPYITIYRNKLFYCHTRFAHESFENSASKKINTKLDELLKLFGNRDLSSHSSMLFKNTNDYIFMVYNMDTNKFDLIRL